MSSTNGAGDYSRLREKWTHEDHLINHRINWLFVSQTLLFAGYGLLLQVRSANPAPPQSVLSKVDRLVWWLPWVGLITSVLILLGVLAAGIALWRLRRQNQETRLDVTPFTSGMGWLSAGGLPIIFVVVWLAMLGA